MNDSGMTFTPKPVADPEPLIVANARPVLVYLNVQRNASRPFRGRLSSLG